MAVKIIFSRSLDLIDIHIKEFCYQLTIPRNNFKNNFIEFAIKEKYIFLILYYML